MWSTVNKLRRILPPVYKYFVLFLAALTGFNAVMEVFSLGMIMPLIWSVTNMDSLASAPYIGRVYLWFGTPSPVSFITWFAVSLFFLFGLKTASNYLMIWCQSYFLAKLSGRLTGNLMTRYVQAPYSFHLETGFAELLNRLNGVYQLITQVCYSLMLILSECAVVVVLALAVFFVMPVVSFIVLGFGVSIFLGLYLPLRSRMIRLGKKAYDENTRFNQALMQALGAIKEVKLSCHEDRFAKAVSDTRLDLAFSSKRMSDLGQIPRLFIDYTAVFVALVLVIISVNLKIPVRELIMMAAVLVAAMFRLLPSFSRIQYNVMNVKGGLFMLDKLYDDLTALDPEFASISAETLPFRESFRAEHVSFSYKPGELPNVIRDISFEIHRNECIAFTGKSGSGKTTMADLLMGFLKPDAGKITVDGCPIADHLRAWRSKIGYVAQNIFLLDDSIRANVAFSAESEIDDAKVESCLKMAQIFDFVQSLPEKERTCVGERGVRLSGGQRQRIAIARALYRDPEILILDEATSALDNETEKAFVDALSVLKGRLTIIMIAHRLSSLTYCDRKIEFEQGSAQ